MAKKSRVYSGKIFNVETEKQAKAGKRFLIERVVHPDFVLIVPFLTPEKLVMERQYRGAIRKYIYELPAGGINKGESLIKAAKRELEEETGYRAKKLQFLFKAYSAPGFVTEMAYVYAAKGLTLRKTKFDDDEIIETEEVSMDQALEMIRSNRIVDMKTIAAILFCVNGRQHNLEDYRYR